MDSERKPFSSNYPGFEEIYRANYGKIYNYFYGCLLQREKTEDLTNEVFLAALRSFPLYSPAKGSVSGWLSGIARHRLQDYFRKAGTRPEVLSEDIPEQGEEQKTVWDDANTLKYPENRRAAHILSQLSPKERDFLELRYGLELSDGEIAIIYGTGREAIRKRYERLLAKCRRM